MLTAWNEITIRNKITNALKQQQFVGFARQAANTRFVFAKSDLLNEFDEHPVTKELQNKDSEDSVVLDHGSLFSFLGFYNQDNPAETLREYIKDNTVMSKIPTISTDNRKIYYNFRVQIPSKTQVYQDQRFELPERWISRSWVETIEKGVGNAAYYVFLATGFFAEIGSRSHFGLQRKTKRKAGGEFKPVDYISGLIDKFIEKFK